jgi:hypothetical protein
MLMNALEENIKKFESQFGAIKVFGQENRGMGFKIGDDKDGDEK